MLSYYVSLHSEFRVVISVTISACKRCSVRRCLPLLVGGLMSYVICVCSVRRCLPLLVGGLMSYVICACFPIVVLNIFCVVFFVVLCILCCQFLWIVHFLIAPSVFSNVYLSICVYFNNSYSVVLQRLYTRISLDIITWLYL